jgi:hypothetical protein
VVNLFTYRTEGINWVINNDAFYDMAYRNEDIDSECVDILCKTGEIKGVELGFQLIDRRGEFILSTELSAGAKTALNVLKVVQAKDFSRGIDVTQAGENVLPHILKICDKQN